MMMRRNYKLIGSAIAASAVMIGFSGTAQAVPSFARQTGMACAACHTTFPELTQFGRNFKLNGYTMTGLKQIESQGGPNLPKLKINEIPALSAMIQTSYTYTKGAAPGTTQNVQFPEQLSLFYAGEITPHIGSFVQLTHDYTPDGGFGMDNSEVRYANHTKNTTYGVVINNGPTISDIYQTTPVWGFPFAGPLGYTAPIIENMGQNVGGIGAYAMFNNHFYVQGNLYKTMSDGNSGTTLTDALGGAGTVKGAAPYWRLAYQTNFGPNFLEIGTYGVQVNLIPTGGFTTDGGGSVSSSASSSGQTDKYRDVAIDAQWERPFGDNSIVVRTSYLHQRADLDASAANVAAATNNGGANSGLTLPKTSTSMNVFKLNGSYHFGSSKALSLGYVHTTGDDTQAIGVDSTNANNLVLNATGTGTTAYVLQGSYYPWENVRLSLQYTGYTKFQGASNNASDNNTTYLLGWFMF